MSQSLQLIAELKRQLKLHGKSYQHVAHVLNLSEASVKRLFSSGNAITLERLEAVCQLIELDMAELFRLATNHQHLITTLTLKQEQQIIADKGLLLVAVCVVNGYSFEQIIHQYTFTDTELIQKMAQLDRLNVIELLPGNKIKLRISPNFSWLPGGPIQQFFQHKVKEEFFQSRFDDQDEKLIMATGLLSMVGNNKIQTRMHRLITDFYDACQDDGELNINDRHGTSMVVAIRRWQFKLFDDFEAEPPQK